MTLITLDGAPSETYDSVFEKCGGVMKAESCGSLPRNKKQVANFKSSATTKSGILCLQ